MGGAPCNGVEATTGKGGGNLLAVEGGVVAPVLEAMGESGWP